MTTNLQTIEDRLDEHFKTSDEPVTISTDKGDIIVSVIGNGWFCAELGDLKASSITPWEAVEEVIEKVREQRVEANRSVWCQAAGFAK